MDILYRLSGRSQDEFFFHVRTRIWRPRSVTLRYSGLAAVIDRTTHAWLLITWLFSSSLFTLWCGCVVLCCVDLFCWIEFYFCNIHSLITEIGLCCFLGVLGSILWHATHTNFGDHRLRGFRGVKFPRFPLTFIVALTTLALPCERVIGLIAAYC